MRTIMAGMVLSLLVQTAMAVEARPSDVYLGYDGEQRIELYLRAAPIALVQNMPSCFGKFLAIASKPGTQEQYGCWDKKADRVAIDWTQGQKNYPASAFYLQ